jgi:hypothetical protein
VAAVIADGDVAPTPFRYAIWVFRESTGLRVMPRRPKTPGSMP